VLEEFYTCQSLDILQFINAEAEFVEEIAKHLYPAIPATATTEEIPETRVFSRQLVAYIAPLLPSAPFCRASDSRIAGICDEQYTSALETLHETDYEKFKDYLTRKTQACFRRWGCPRTSDKAMTTSAAPCDASSAPRGATPTPMRRLAPVASDDDEPGEDTLSAEQQSTAQLQ
jgi:hypothetical protein